MNKLIGKNYTGYGIQRNIVIQGKNYDGIVSGVTQKQMSLASLTHRQSISEIILDMRESINPSKRAHQFILHCDGTQKDVRRVEVKEKIQKFCNEKTNTVKFDLLLSTNSTLNLSNQRFTTRTNHLLMQLKNISPDLEGDDRPAMCIVVTKHGLLAKFSDPWNKTEFDHAGRPWSNTKPELKRLIPFVKKNITKDKGYKYWISISVTYKKLKNDKVKFIVKAKDKENDVQVDHIITHNELHKCNLKFGIIHLPHDTNKLKADVTVYFRNIRCQK